MRPVHALTIQPNLSPQCSTVPASTNLALRPGSYTWWLASTYRQDRVNPRNALEILADRQLQASVHARNWFHYVVGSTDLETCDDFMRGIQRYSAEAFFQAFSVFLFLFASQAHKKWKLDWVWASFFSLQLKNWTFSRCASSCVCL